MKKINWELGETTKAVLESLLKVVLLIIFSFLPLAVNIIIAVTSSEDRLHAAWEKIIPGELLAVCLSFLAPLFMFVIQVLRKNKKVPGLSFFFTVSFPLYVFAFALYLIAKNNWSEGIDVRPGHRDLYLYLVLFSLGVTAIIRWYTYYQEGKPSDYKENLDRQQEEFNKSFEKSI